MLGEQQADFVSASQLSHQCQVCRMTTSTQPVLFLSVCTFKRVRRNHAAVFTFNVWIFRHQAVMHVIVAADLHGFKLVDWMSGRYVTVLAPSRYSSATKAEETVGGIVVFKGKHAVVCT